MEEKQDCTMYLFSLYLKKAWKDIFPLSKKNVFPLPFLVFFHWKFSLKILMMK